jgi:hypothetical protein
MSRKWFFLGSFIIFLVAMAVLGSLSTSPAQAKCSDTPADSSCITSHEYQGADPVYRKGEWHEIHASKDCCWNCHGGNTQAQDKNLAHAGMTVQPLSNHVPSSSFRHHPLWLPRFPGRWQSWEQVSWDYCSWDYIDWSFEDSRQLINHETYLHFPGG